MIKSLEVTNLQSHSYSLLEFHKGVNIIKGRSHSGKSSLIRALRWALQNKPSGFHFKSHFSDKKDSTQVSIEFDNDDYISRVRDTSFNGYILSGNEDGLEALRTDVPDEVKAITQINNINIQSQADKYFMLQETPGTVAKELNNIVGLDIIDEVNKKVSRIYSAADATCSSVFIDIKDKKEEIKKYKHLKKAERLINKIDILYGKHSALEDDRISLISRITELEKTQEEMDNVVEWLSVEKPFKEIKKKQEELIKLEEKDKLLVLLLTDIKKKENEIYWADEPISLEKPMKQAKSLSNKLSEMRFKYDKLLKLYQDMENTEKSLNFVTDTLRTDTKERNQLLKQYATDFCPKCGAYRQHWRKKY